MCQIGAGACRHHHGPFHRHDVEQLRRHDRLGDGGSLHHAVDVACGQELGQVGGIDQIAEADPARCAGCSDSLQRGPLTTGAGDHDQDVRGQQGGGRDQDLQTLLPPEIASIHRYHRLGIHSPGVTEAVRAGPRSHDSIIDPVGEHADRVAPSRLRADLSAHCS